MKRVLVFAIVLAAFCAVYFSLFKKHDLIKPFDIALPDNLVNTVICYETHVRPMIAGYCAPCHTERKAGFVSLKSAQDCSKNIDKAVKMVVKGKMPPKDNLKLTGAQVAVLKAWKEGGFKDCPAAK